MTRAKKADLNTSVLPSTVSFLTESLSGHNQRVDLEFMGGQLSRLSARATQDGWVTFDWQEVLQILSLILKSDAHGPVMDCDLSLLSTVAYRVEEQAKAKKAGAK